MSYEDFSDLWGRGLPNPKASERRRLLEERPELRRRIAIPALRGIIPFIDFKCALGSSIARDQAIEGSDIDGALVVLEQPVPVEEELQFVQQLRDQGFTAYHPMEFALFAAWTDDELARVQVERDAATTHEDNTRAYYAINALQLERVTREFQQITFMTREQIADPATSSDWNRRYVTGHSIRDYSVPREPEWWELDDYGNPL